MICGRLGYEVTIFEKQDKPGGLMRTNIPSFRLPEKVLDDEVGMILDMGVEIHYNSPVSSLKDLLSEGYDAVFVGTGAPRGKDLDLPGRHDTDRIHIGIDWLESVAFEHIDSIGERVLIIGVGNTAMDCCRSSRRLGGKDIKVMARRPRGYFKASPWELDDAEEESIEIVINHAPKRFVVENGMLKGMEFERLEWDADAKKSRVIETVFLPADDVILAIGQENAFPWIERDLGIQFDKWDMPVVDEATFQSTRPGVFFGGDAAWGPKNIIWAVAHGHQAAISIHNHCQGIPVTDRPKDGMNLVSQKMGLSEWSYHNDYNPAHRQKMKHVDLVQRFEQFNIEVELGFRPSRPRAKCSAASTAMSKPSSRNRAASNATPASISVRCNASPSRAMAMKQTCGCASPRLPLTPIKPFTLPAPLPQTGRAMVKDEDLCVHCGLCAERCPTSAWDMQKFDLITPYAGAPCTTSYVSA